MRGVFIALAALAAAIAADAQTITVSTATQTRDQQVVTVTVSAPTTLVSKADAVAMYPASQSNFTVSPPLKYKIITYTVSGANSVATLTFNLLNWRQSTVFYYLGATTTPVSAGPGVESTFTVLSGKNFGSATVTQANPYEPTQASTLAVAALQGALLMIFLA
ncbi:g13492 [Coccomyxa viridis]|uniref:G13492 protein n=1 Tax=Coccomyxa viridis TaxID=1274662 RepID=A0ABP1GCW7_9CHLO